MTWLWGKFRLRVSSRRGILARERLGYPMGSFGEVFDTLGKRIEQQGGDIHLSARVLRVVVEDAAATGLEVQLPDQNPEIRGYDAIIATTPSYIFTRLVPPLPEAYQERLVNVRYLAAVVLILVLDRPLSDKYWMNIADLSLPFVGVIEHTNLVDPGSVWGNHLVYLTNYPSRDSELYQMSAEELLAAYLPHLQKINPEFDPSWIREYFHHKIDGAQPIIGVNYGERIPEHRTPFRNLYLANTTQIYPKTGAPITRCAWDAWWNGWCWKTPKPGDEARFQSQQSCGGPHYHEKKGPNAWHGLSVLPRVIVSPSAALRINAPKPSLLTLMRLLRVCSPRNDHRKAQVSGCKNRGEE